MKKVLLESIVYFQSFEDFEDSTKKKYDDLSKKELFEILLDYYYPGEHETNWYEYEDINTNFLGYQVEDNKDFLLSTESKGLVIGLSKIIGGKNE